MDLQTLILSLQRYWAEQGCVLQQPFDVEVGAGTMHPETFLRVLGPEPYRVAYVQPSRRPADARYGENPFRLGKHLQDLGFWILNDVIWVKTNPMPNWLGVRFTNATENLIWAVKHKDAKKYTFHKDVAKKFGIGSVGANVWVLPICTGSQRLKNDNGQKLHSTQKPIELLKRVILVSTNEGDLILDPVAGTGTTGYVASALRRDFVMIERNAKYIEGMVHRFEKPLHLGTEPVPSSQKAERYIPLEDTG